jgi:hypothetical protein
MHRCVRGYPYGASLCLQDVCGLLEAGTDCWQLPQVARVPAEVLVGVLRTAVQQAGSPTLLHATQLRSHACRVPHLCPIRWTQRWGSVRWRQWSCCRAALPPR